MRYLGCFVLRNALINQQPQAMANAAFLRCFDRSQLLLQGVRWPAKHSNASKCYRSVQLIGLPQSRGGDVHKVSWKTAEKDKP